MLSHFSAVIMEKLWRTITRTDLVVGTGTLPRKHNKTENELNFKVRCRTHLKMTVDVLCVCYGISETKRSLAKDFCKTFCACGRSNCEVSSGFTTNLTHFFSLFSTYLFFYPYMFQATSAHHQEGTVVSIRPLV
jgi:hypothetical protein